MLYQSKGNMLITQKPGQGDRSADSTSNHKGQYVKLWIATVNIGTLRRQYAEIVEIIPVQRRYMLCAGNLFERRIDSKNYGKELSF